MLTKIKSIEVDTWVITFGSIAVGYFYLIA